MFRVKLQALVSFFVMRLTSLYPRNHRFLSISLCLLEYYVTPIFLLLWLFLCQFSSNAAIFQFCHYISPLTGPQSRCLLFRHHSLQRRPENFRPRSQDEACPQGVGGDSSPVDGPFLPLAVSPLPRGRHGFLVHSSPQTLVLGFSVLFLPWSGRHVTSWPLFWVKGFQERRRLVPPEPWWGCVATCALALLLGVRGDGLWARGPLSAELSWPPGVFPRLRNAADVQHPAHHFLSSSSSEQIETTDRPHLSSLRCSMVANTE